MTARDINSERHEAHQPGPEEHPGEDEQFVDAERTRLKKRFLEDPAPEDQPDDASERSETRGRR
jgi:hypothetical protein